MRFLSVLRPHQWMKNFLLFVPLLTSQSELDQTQVWLAFFGFLGFSLVCSANYILNDLIDVDRDKQVPYKSKRPIAAGQIKISVVKVYALIVLCVGLLICLNCSRYLALLASIYVFLGIIYSWKLKNIPQVNLVILVLFYEIRIFAGATLFNLVVSFWLIIFSFTIFSSLASLKKYTKVALLSGSEADQDFCENSRRELVYFGSFGISFAVLSMLTFALYLNSEEVTLVYKNPKILWILVPLIQYLLLRMWNRAMHGKMHYDPIVFILKDKSSFVCLGVMVMVTVMVGRLS